MGELGLGCRAGRLVSSTKGQICREGRPPYLSVKCSTLGLEGEEELGAR